MLQENKSCAEKSNIHVIYSVNNKKDVQDMSNSNSSQTVYTNYLFGWTNPSNVEINHYENVLHHFYHNINVFSLSFHIKLYTIENI